MTIPDEAGEAVEAVARAISAAEGVDADADIWDAETSTLVTPAWHYYRISAKAALAAAAPHLVPPGWQLVPKEPTEAMQVAGGLKCEAIMFEGDPDGTGVIFRDMGHVYRAMLSAAPPPPEKSNG